MAPDQLDRVGSSLGELLYSPHQEGQPISFLSVYTRLIARISFPKARSLGHLPHRPNARVRKCPSLICEITNYVLNYIAQFAVDRHWIIAVDSRNQIRTLPNISLVFVAPFNPFMILIARLRNLHSSCGCATPAPYSTRRVESHPIS